ncbi:MAG: glycosyltransferase, partial [Pseudomonadota bacterium]
ALPYQELSTFFEKAIIPFVMHLPIWGLLPLRWISLFKSSSLLVANGQWLAIRRSAYFEVGGHECVSHSLLEDMELGRKLVQAGFKLLPVLSTQDVRVRMYDSWDALREGFTKNLYFLSGGNYFSLAAVFGLSLWIYVNPLFLSWKEAPGAGACLLLLLAFRSITAFSFRVSPGSVWLHPLGALGFLYLLGRSGWMRACNQVTWRGRQVPASN